MFGKGVRRIGRYLQRDTDEATSVDISEMDGVRALHLGNATVQSAMRISAPFELELTYTRGMMCFLLFGDHVQDAVILGLGGGSIPKYIHRHLPHIRTTAVELNPAVVSAARNQFHLPDEDERLRVFIGDGVEYIRNNPAGTDALLLDAYDAKGLPNDLSSQEFYDSCAEALTDNGILVVNLWGSDRRFDIYLQRIEQSFGGRVLMMPTGRPGNIIIFAFKRNAGDLRWKSLRERAKQLQSELRIEFLDFVERLRDHNVNTANRLIL